MPVDSMDWKAVPMVSGASLVRSDTRAIHVARCSKSTPAAFAIEALRCIAAEISFALLLLL